ncbi:lactosylceramide 4-alpha-galactosyltransferase-like [Culicoides brevitarsis]|uniref:lactosylceramide 4-alpha-galactosyltransferase-like n=1 Tax=Culicoides brevitarsis TaxID=469753 RepID=UPI00307CA58C
MDSELLLSEGQTTKRSFKAEIGLRFLKRLILGFICVGALILVAYLDIIPDTIKEIRPTGLKISGILNTESSFCPSKAIENKTIYFIESKRPKDNILNLGPRQACAIESAAKNNPDFNVTLFALHVTDLAENSPYTKALRQYSNIKIVPTTLKEFTKDTIAEQWVTKGDIYKSKHATVHFSDFLRLFVLYKYGGIYLDTDFIVLKSLGDLKPGWSVAETTYWVASAAMSFDATGYGHYLAEVLVREFMNTYNGTEYAYNGPGLLTRVAQRLCFTTETKKMKRGPCFDFEILDTKLFYPIGYDAKDPLFNPQNLTKTLEMVKDAYAVHCWNGLVGSVHLKVGTKAGIGVLAEKHCPHVYASVKDVFR